MSIQNKTMLITYSDSLGNNLKDLYENLEKYFGDAVGGVHLLPFFPSTGDRGFAPVDYDQVDPAFGDWEDDAEIGCEFISPIDLCCFIQTFWDRDFDIPHIEKEGLWNRIGQVEQDQTKGVSQTEFTHHNRNRNHDDLERYENPKDQEGVHDGKSFSLTHITSDGVGCHGDNDHYCK